jgi:hypothetical protein
MAFSIMALNAEFHHAECRSAECRYAECRYAECRYAECRSVVSIDLSTSDGIWIGHLLFVKIVLFYGQFFSEPSALQNDLLKITFF